MIEICDCEGLDRLKGLVVDAYFKHESMHFVGSPALRTLDGDSVVFSASSHDLAKYFEVFSLTFSLNRAVECDWKRLARPSSIENVRELWRCEWIEPSVGVSGLLGSSPHFTHFTASHSVPANAAASAKIMAGVEILLSDGTRFAVVASAADKFAVDFAATGDAVDRLLAGFPCEAP